MRPWEHLEKVFNVDLFFLCWNMVCLSDNVLQTSSECCSWNILWDLQVKRLVTGALKTHWLTWKLLFVAENVNIFQLKWLFLSILLHCLGAACCWFFFLQVLIQSLSGSVTELHFLFLTDTEAVLDSSERTFLLFTDKTCHFRRCLISSL